MLDKSVQGEVLTSTLATTGHAQKAIQSMEGSNIEQQAVNSTLALKIMGFRSTVLAWTAGLHAPYIRFSKITIVRRRPWKIERPTGGSKLTFPVKKLLPLPDDSVRITLESCTAAW